MRRSNLRERIFSGFDLSDGGTESSVAISLILSGVDKKEQKFFGRLANPLDTNPTEPSQADGTRRAPAEIDNPV